MAARAAVRRQSNQGHAAGLAGRAGVTGGGPGRVRPSVASQDRIG